MIRVLVATPLGRGGNGAAGPFAPVEQADFDRTLAWDREAREQGYTTIA